MIDADTGHFAARAINSPSSWCVVANTSRILDPQAGQRVDVEESPVVDLVQRRPPVRETIRLHFEQLVQVVEALGASGFAVEALDGLVDAPPTAGDSADQPREPAARHFLLAMTFALRVRDRLRCRGRCSRAT